jgi:uncharacterized protein
MRRVNQVRDSAADLPFGKWQRVRGDLPDVSIWLALVQSDHTHHAAAQAYWQETMLQSTQEADTESLTSQAQKMYFCRTTMLGLVRVLCQSERAKGRHIEMHQAMAAYQRFMDIEEVAFLQEPWLGVDATLTMLLNVHQSLPFRLSTDVYLAAVAQTTGLRLVSFDRDYLRFDGLDCLILDDKPSAV